MSKQGTRSVGRAESILIVVMFAFCFMLFAGVEMTLQASDGTWFGYTDLEKAKTAAVLGLIGSAGVFIPAMFLVALAVDSRQPSSA